MFARLSRVTTASLMVLALASAVLIVDASVDPEPAAAGWESEEVQEWSTNLVCGTFSAAVAAYAFAGPTGYVYLTVRAAAAANGAQTFAAGYIAFRACRYMTTLVTRWVRRWVEDTVEAVVDMGTSQHYCLTSGLGFCLW